MMTPDTQLLDVRILPTGQGTVIVALAGEVDVTSTPLLRRELLRVSDAGAKRIVIDATDLTFIDSTGISVLVFAHRALLERGGYLEVHNAGPAVRTPLDVCGISQHLRVTPPAGEDPPAA